MSLCVLQHLRITRNLNVAQSAVERSDFLFRFLVKGFHVSDKMILGINAAELLLAHLALAAGQPQWQPHLSISSLLL